MNRAESASAGERWNRSASPVLRLAPVPCVAVLLTAAAVWVGHPYSPSLRWDVVVAVGVVSSLLAAVITAEGTGSLGLVPVRGGAGDGQTLLVVPWRLHCLVWVRTPVGPLPYQRWRTPAGGWFELDRVASFEVGERACACSSDSARLRLSCRVVVVLTGAALVVAPHNAIVAIALAALTVAPAGLAVRGRQDLLACRPGGSGTAGVLDGGG